MRANKAFRPDRIGSYFRTEWLPLTLVTIYRHFICRKEL